MTLSDLGLAWDAVKQSVITWIIIVSSAAIHELQTILDKKPHTLALTTVVIIWVPGLVTMTFLTWLWIHFFIRYQQSGYWWFR